MKVNYHVEVRHVLKVVVSGVLSWVVGEDQVQLAGDLVLDVRMQPDQSKDKAVGVGSRFLTSHNGREGFISYVFVP